MNYPEGLGIKPESISLLNSNLNILKDYYSKKDGSTNFVLMKTDGSYEQLAADQAAVEDSIRWLKETDKVTVTLWDEVPIAVAPANFVELEVAETDPGLKGDTAQGGTKPATLSTGAVVKVPLFINIGEVVRVDTRTAEYQNRVKQ